ncbi:hypothetical protein [Ruegeria arenilitoris]|uniref:hypothetical protein n=1 Tax=Ruegeria arenilitoris TaxID=1173585 RepID=UPI00147A4EBA|nr:hypothetical protein [Ruegeria arenilitoris]
MRGFLGLSFAGSLSALGVGACCVLPMTMMLLGLGGNWLALFGQIAALSYYVLAASTVLIAVAWLVAYPRDKMRHLKWGLAASTAMTALAWVVVFNEARINEFLIQQM